METRNETAGVRCIGRREFLWIGGAGLFVGCSSFGAADRSETPVVRFGMVTDIHYADLDPDKAPCGVVGRRYYRESLRKLGEAVALFNTRGLDFAIELGDFKDDSGGREPTLAHLDRIEEAFSRFNGPRYHVAGNHDFDCVTDEEFFSRIPNAGVTSKTGYYSFECGKVKFIVLNACFDSKLQPYSCNNPWNDANVPPDELAWFESELESAKGNVIVFCHQRLDNVAEPNHIVKNAAAVRSVMERSGKVRGVITGHQHRGGMCMINGIPYYSLRALVCDSGEGANSFAEVAVYPSGNFTVTGWRNAVSRGAKGEFPERGLAVFGGDDVPNGAEMATLEASASLETALWRFPKSGILLCIRCGNGNSALAAAQTLRDAERLAQGVLMMNSRADLVSIKAKCPWVKTGLSLSASAGPGLSWSEDESRKKLRDVAGIGVEFVQVPRECHISPEQFVFLHDRGIRTISGIANDKKSMVSLVREGHDFIVTEDYLALRPMYEKAFAAFSV